MSSVDLRSNPMMGIKHARNAVESKSIKLVLVHPVPQITKEKSHHLMTSIIEKSAIPQLMLSFRTTVEIAAVRPIKLVQSIQHIFGGVAVNHIEKNRNSQAMCGINKLFQFLRRTIPTAWSKEAVDLVAETCIVCVLHNSHQLDNIISQVMYSRQHILCKLLVCRHSQLRRRDSNMCFVDSNAERLLRSWVFEHISFGLRRVPESCIVDWRDVEILSDICDPSGYTFDSFAGGSYHGDLAGQQMK
jgi:hypothetical protein